MPDKHDRFEENPDDTLDHVLIRVPDRSDDVRKWLERFREKKKDGFYDAAPGLLSPAERNERGLQPPEND